MIDRANRDELQMIAPPSLLARRFQAAKPWPQMDTGSTRPGYGLRPERVYSAFRAAEQGSPLQQCDIFEDVLENDGHARGQFLQRYSGVAFTPWAIRAGGKDAIDKAAAEALSTALSYANVLELFWHVMEAIGFGYSAVNTQWSFSPEGVVVPSWFLLPAHRRLRVSNENDALLWTDENTPEGVPLSPGEWMEARRPGRKVVRTGLMRTVTWWCLFKRLSITDWIVFAEKFGVPLVLGTYQRTASDADRAALLSALTEIGSDGQAVLADTTNIIFKDGAVRSGDVSALHPQIATRCDAEISKLVTGGTLNTENGGSGSYGLGQVHEKRAVQLSKGDAFWLATMFHRYIVIPFLAYNPQFARAKPPVLVSQVHVEGKAEAETYSMLQKMGQPIGRQDMADRFGLRDADGSDALTPIPDAKPDASPPKSAAA